MTDIDRVLEESKKRYMERHEFEVMKSDYRALSDEEKMFYNEMTKCSTIFKKSDFPMQHEKFIERIYKFIDDNNIENKIDLDLFDFITTMEFVVYEKYGLIEVHDSGWGNSNIRFEK